MITIKDIARMSGYSTGTVSRVLNNRTDVSEEAREKINKIISEYNYQPNSNAKMLKQTLSPDISVIVRGNTSLFLQSILAEIQIRMREHREMLNVLFIGETDDEIEATVQLGQNMKPKGLIFLGGNPENFREKFSRIPVPSVLVTVDAESLGFDLLSSFSTDDESGAARAVGELYSRGHRRIGILGGRSGVHGELKESFSKPRIDGAVQELNRRGIAFDLDRDYEACAYSTRGGYDAARKLLQKSPDLTGIFCMNDAIAIGAMRAFKDMGMSVPEDISVVGFDGAEYVRFTIPRLSTIRQDSAMLARKSVDDLLLRISYGGAAVHEKIPFTYVDGESVASPRK
ncbi:MAG: LacI family DNA-binding transcriptional regulator [Mogibacterium sp.]|nr:LacI family DNA-binding transcriptional regulator [Mogibacterium sp.]